VPGLLKHAFLFALIVFCWAQPSSEARAHATGENYVWLNVGENELHGLFEIRLEDLRTKLGLSIPPDPEGARERVAETAPEVWAYIREKFSITADGQEIVLEPQGTDLREAEGLGHFAKYFYRTPEMVVPDLLTVRNKIFIDEDPFHRALLLIETNAKTGETYGGEFTVQIFSPTNVEQELDLTAVEAILEPRDFVWQGVLSIWIGTDHVLFLLTLLLPAVLVYQASATNGRWSRLPHFRSALWNVIKIVIVFAVAHSIALILAALDIVQLPSRFVETMIALSIIVVALNNIFPRYRASTLAIIFFFGLFHGLGLASVMGDLPFRMVSLIKVVLAFNIGVEIGQVAIVAAAIPLLYWLAQFDFYPRWVLKGGSVVIAIIAAYWLFERATGITA